MRNDEGGTVFFVASAKECERHTLCAVLIEGRRGLVKEKEGLGQGKSSSQEEALSLSTGQFGGVQFQQTALQRQGFHDGRECACTIQGRIVLQVMCETHEVCSFLCQGLQLLRHVGGIAANVMDMSDIQGGAAYLSSTCCEGYKAQYRPQEGRFATAALAGDANKLAPTYGEIEIAKELAVAKGDGDGTESEQS